MTTTWKAVKLLKNRLYPTYQLHAYMANRKTAPEDGLKIAILTVLEWLRARLADPIPPELELPSHEDYAQVELDRFQSVHINYGYIIDIISLVDKGMWTLQITEPDLGSEPGNPQQKRPPVPGRVLETNISFSIQRDQLECGVQTIISDPEHTAELAEVYRPTIVKRLANNPDFGLKNSIPLEPTVKPLATLEQLKRMLELYHGESNQTPLVIFTKIAQHEQIEDDSLPLASLSWEALRYNCGTLCLGNDLLPQIHRTENKELDFTNPYHLLADHEQGKNHLYHDFAKEAKEAQTKKKQGKKQKLLLQPLNLPKLLRQDPYLGVEKRPPLPPQPQEATAQASLTYGEPPYNYQRFAYSALGYAQVYLLEPQLVERLQQLEKLEVPSSLMDGAIIVLEPPCFGGQVDCILPQQEKPYARLCEIVLNYPREKKYSFRHLSFLSHARDILIDNSKQAELLNARNKDEWQAYLQQQEARWTQEQRKRDLTINLLNEQLTQLRQELQEAEALKAQLRQEIVATKEANRHQLEQKDDYLNYYRRIVDLPACHADIPLWVKKYYGDRLYLHPKAVALLQDKSAQIVDLKLICDALDYLATEYWAQRYAKLSVDEAQVNCSQKYGRPFEITPVGQASINMNPGQYKVKYYTQKDKPKESDLDTHLKVGNASELLLRIYFFHDDDKQLLVIGSLPRHLKNATIK